MQRWLRTIHGGIKKISRDDIKISEATVSKLNEETQRFLSSCDVLTVHR